MLRALSPLRFSKVERVRVLVACLFVLYLADDHKVENGANTPDVSLWRKLQLFVLYLRCTIETIRATYFAIEFD